MSKIISSLLFHPIQLEQLLKVYTDVSLLTITMHQVDIPIQQSYLWYGSSSGDMDPQVCNLCPGLYTLF